MTQDKQLMAPLRRMPIVTCSCGKQLLIVPDLAEMNRLIKAHLVDHKKLTGEAITEDEMAELVLEAISQNFY
jgi:hypothetical protein